MGRKANDGKGRLGGRAKGTPNKDKSLKQILNDHAIEYFTPSIAAEKIGREDISSKDEAEIAMFVKKNKGKTFSRFELDLIAMKPADRAKLEADMLNYHMPKMQAVSADMGVKVKNMTLFDRLDKLRRGETVEPEE